MKLLRINMGSKTVTEENVPEKYAELGGRGLTAVMINSEVPPTCDPLGPENKLIFAPGFLSGTSLVNSSRISIGAKSPLTGGIKESNAGGTVAAFLGKLGIKAVVVEGKPDGGELFLLRIDENGNAALLSAENYKGIRTYAVTEKLLQSYGEKNAVMCIGPAGEYQLASASIQTSDVDGHPSRAAGRGGLGAVMGSKGLKAIVIAQPGKRNDDEMADPEAFKEGATAIAKFIKEDVFTGIMLPEQGTASLVAAVNSMGAFPSYNATKGMLEGWEKISGDALAETIKKRGGETTHLGCAQCIVRCSNRFVDEGGEYVTSALEYETIWSMGGMTGISDIDIIARLDFLADDIGVDTMNTGVAVAVAMDAGHKSFGDGRAAIEMLEEIARGTEFGRVLGNGPEAVGRHFDHHRVPAVKGQSIAAYDPRGMQGNGVTYATSPMGADHTAGNLVGSYLGGVLNPLEAEGQVEASRNAQIKIAYFDCTGLCMLVASALASPESVDALLKVINAKLGTKMGHDDLTTMGLKVLGVEKEFNRKAGLTNKDDRLPAFFHEEPLPPHNKVFLISDEELDSTLN